MTWQRRMVPLNHSEKPSLRRRLSETPAFGERCGTCDNCAVLAAAGGDAASLVRDFAPPVALVLAAAAAAGDASALPLGAHCSPRPHATVTGLLFRDDQIIMRHVSARLRAARGDHIRRLPRRC